MKQSYTVPEIPRLWPKPTWVAGVRTPAVSLDGEWRIRQGQDMESPDGWEAITVPSFMSVQRRAMPNAARRYVVKRAVDVREEWANMRLFLRFESVNGLAEVFIDGEKVGSHSNGFLAFGFDITAFVCGKKQFTLAVAVEELTDKVSTFSLGGILRSVALYVLPEKHLTALYADTRFDHQFRHAEVAIRYEMNATSGDTRVMATLVDPMGCTVAEQAVAPQSVLPVKNPLAWDAEHPWLYTLRLRVETVGIVTQETELKIGIRQIDRAENRLYVNGKEVKLRGVCRHEISALNGRCLTPEIIREDVALFKEANCNYIRTSHYPPSEYFLDLCDEMGVYVEDELPLAFIARTLDYTQRDPAHTERYLSVFGDIYARDANHPSVLMWSLCNESFGGHNFDLLNRFAQATDPSRPTKFSYPMTIREEHAPVDIWSIHYSNLEEDLSEKKDNVSVAGAQGKDMPVLHDEYAHVPCYNRTEHRRDPNVRTFWGEGLKKFWDAIWNTDGALGGAIWAGIDETDIYRGGDTRLEWGIIDVWRRRKPEHYMTRKAYSPIVAALVSAEEDCVLVSVENRFCHTNLSEVKIRWQYAGQTGTVRGPEALPRETALLELAVAPVAGETLRLDFHDAFGRHVDEYEFVPLEEAKAACAKEYAPVSLSESGNVIAVRGEGFCLKFSKETGLIVSGEAAGECVLIGGPILHVPYFRLGKWMPGAIRASRNGKTVRMDIRGTYEHAAEVSFALTVHPDGRVETAYTIEKLLRQLPHREKLRVGVDCGGLDELGVAFIAAPGKDCLSWKRKGLYTTYPKEHIARNEGCAPRYSVGSQYGVKPEIAWGEEMQNVILNGKYDVRYKGTNDFRSLKADVVEASLFARDGKASLSAVSDGRHSVRAEVEDPEANVILADDPVVCYAGSWAEVEDFRGSRGGVEKWSREAGASAELAFTGTGVVWYGPVDTVYGIARVYLDGKLADERINQRVAGVDFPGSAAGYDKKYDYPLYSAEDLPYGPHTLRIEVTGEKAPDAGDAYVVVDHLRVICEKGEEPVRFAVLNDYNYPHIAWGNPCRPAIYVEDGYQNSVTVKLTPLSGEE